MSLLNNIGGAAYQLVGVLTNRAGSYQPQIRLWFRRAAVFFRE
jgi:hypothetical protein